MSISQALLITGGTAEKRKNKALEMVAVKVAPNPDVFTLETDEQSLGVGEIRELIHYLATKPMVSPHKTALVTQAEKLTVPAQNALLKTLEEPPENAVIVLLCPDPDLLLPTIVSRCHLLRLPAEVLSLPATEEKQLRSLLEAVPNYSIGERLQKAFDLASNRPSAIAWLDKVTVVLHQQLLLSERLSNLSNLSSLTLKARRYLAANANTRLTLENLLLNW